MKTTRNNAAGQTISATNDSFCSKNASKIAFKTLLAAFFMLTSPAQHSLLPDLRPPLSLATGDISITFPGGTLNEGDTATFYIHAGGARNPLSKTSRA